ncbi:hypothetical protein [Flavicella sediminum]|uniref:hypothetical protein n=1 Tax=Flavicella sediminum TaxID=2585141 RepID=UPI00111DACEA|nr:hypothetical protein [Flavicella sediminum]
MKKLFLSFVLISLVYVGYLNSPKYDKYPKGVRNAFRHSSKSQKDEFEKVLHHFSTEKDSLKFKAAIFLIENMHYHNYIKPIREFDLAFDSIAHFPKIELNIYREEAFKSMLDSISDYSNLEQPNLIKDIESAKADFLIENIELAFKAWYKIPKGNRASFDDFCNFILPYRSSNEPLEIHSRRKLFYQYKWVSDYIEKGVSLETIVDSIKSDFNFRTFIGIGSSYPFPLSTSQLEKSKLGQCGDGVNYYVNVMRSIGIMAAKDYVEHWGNDPFAKSHSWIYTQLGSEVYLTDVHKKSNIKGVYKNESIPKVYRTRFDAVKNTNSIHTDQDVTHKYILVMDVDIDNIFNVNAKASILTVFDKREGWFPVVQGQKTGENFKFSNIGYNVLYLPMDKESKKPLNYPFFIDASKKIRFFKPDKNVLDSVVLTRKIGLSTRRYRGKRFWLEALNGSVIEASNNSEFINAKVLHEVSNFNSTHIQKIKITDRTQYKYIRFNSKKPKSFLAKLAFYDVNMKPLQGEIIEKNILKETKDYKYGAFDDNTLTYSGGDYFKLGLKFSKPQTIGFVEFQSRNDDNHINKGEDYELFYWDKNWKSLGKQKAQDTLLHYNNVPKNALLWLRNLTKGREEHIFCIDENKQQHWLGFENAKK